MINSLRCAAIETLHQNCAGRQGGPQQNPFFPSNPDHKSERSGHPQAQAEKAIEQRTNKTKAHPAAEVDQQVRRSIFLVQQAGNAPDAEQAQRHPVKAWVHDACMPNRYNLGPNEYTASLYPLVIRTLQSMLTANVQNG